MKLFGRKDSISTPPASQSAVPPELQPYYATADEGRRRPTWLMPVLGGLATVAVVLILLFATFLAFHHLDHKVAPKQTTTSNNNKVQQSPQEKNTPSSNTNNKPAQTPAGNSTNTAPVQPPSGAALPNTGG